MAALVAASRWAQRPARAAQSAPDAAQARAHAREILKQRRFRGSRVPRPFAGVLRWLGDRLQPVADFVDDLADWVPGGRPVLL